MDREGRVRISHMNPLVLRYRGMEAGRGARIDPLMEAKSRIRRRYQGAGHLPNSLGTVARFGETNFADHSWEEWPTTMSSLKC